MSRSKDIGTRAETGVVRYARANGFPHADRLALKGSADEGDVLLAPGAILEVKSGKAAKAASFNQITAWLEETETERRNHGANVAALVVHRAGYGPERCGSWAFWRTLTDPFPHPSSTTLEVGLRLWRAMGYGTPLGGDPND